MCLLLGFRVSGVHTLQGVSFLGDRLADGASCFSLECHEGDSSDSDTSDTFARAFSPPGGPHEAHPLGPPSEGLSTGTPREGAPEENEADDKSAASRPQYPETKPQYLETKNPHSTLGCPADALLP